MKGTLNAESPVWMESFRNQHSLTNGIFGEKKRFMLLSQMPYKGKRLEMREVDPNFSRGQ